MPDTAADTAVPLPFKTPVTVVVKVRFGVEPPELLPAKPFAVATPTEVNVPPEPVADNVPPEKLTPEPIVALLNPPEPLPYKRLVPDVAGA